MRFLLLPLLLLLAGCAGMSKDECRLADWRAIGFEDGSRGAPATAISPRRQACAKKAGVVPDLDAYLAGREAGLQEFCRPANGFAFGAGGGTYQGVCSGASEATFMAAYQSGAHLYRLNADLATAVRALGDAHHRLDHLRARTAEAESALISPATPHPARIDYLADLKHFSEERGRIEASLPGLHIARERAEAALEHYRQHLASQPPYQGGGPLAAR